MSETLVQETLDNSALADASMQYITFTVGNDTYALDIMLVREIRGGTKTTPIPNADPTVIGVTNLRGTVIPIIDPRTKFGLPASVSSDANVVIIVAIDERIIGIAVDAVSDIISILRDEIQPVPEVEIAQENMVISGVIIQEEKLISILQLDQLAPKVDLAS